MTQAQQFRELLAGGKPIVLIGAHNALSARLGEQAGFEGIWASSLEISTAAAKPDANYLTMTEALAVCKSMVDAVSVPIIVDADNGYGNAINVIRTTRDFEAAGVAGICIEDNVFPKRNSFFTGVQRDLVSIEEHVGKIRAAKAAQRTNEFLVIARTEALIAGWGHQEALRRAHAYAEAGADALMVHCKTETFDELEGFMKLYDLDTPMIAVPTKYKHTTVEQLFAAGFQITIFANHAVRSAIKGMRECLAVLRREGCAAAVDEHCVSLGTLFDLVEIQTLRDNESAYLPTPEGRPKVIILAAGAATELGDLAADRPKAMLDIKGKPIILRQVESLHSADCKDIVVVRGYEKEKIDIEGVRTIDNDAWADGHICTSLFAAEAEMDDGFVLSYGDIACEPTVIEKLLACEADIALVIDHAVAGEIADGHQPATRRDYVALANAPDPPAPQGERFMTFSAGNTLSKIGPHIAPQKAHGEWIGLAKFTATGAAILREHYHRILAAPSARPFHNATSAQRAGLTDLLADLLAQGISIAAVDIYKGWIEIDTFEDYIRAWKSTPR